MDVDPAIGLVVRRLTLGSGPLKRTPDRIQAWLRLALVVLLLAAAPIGMAVGTAAREHAQTTAADERRQLIEVRAVLTEDAHPVSGGALADAVLVPATWRGAPGSRHAGQVSPQIGLGRVVDGDHKGASQPVRPGQLLGELCVDELRCGDLHLDHAMVAGLLE